LSAGGDHAIKEHSTKVDTDGGTLFSGEAWFDPIETGIRDRVRGFIEELLEQELTAALGGRSKHERVVEHHQGYRNGTRERQLTGSFGTVPLSVPRARLADTDGGTQEWRSEALPRYARRTRQVEALIASAYLAGTNTRRVKRALAALLRAERWLSLDFAHITGTRGQGRIRIARSPFQLVIARHHCDPSHV